MVAFIRKNALLISGTFTAADGSGDVPTNAEVVIVYPTLAGRQTATIEMSLDTTTNIWSASWDSSVAIAGRVDWMAHCWGGVTAAAEGSFDLRANLANTA